MNQQLSILIYWSESRQQSVCPVVIRVRPGYLQRPETDSSNRLAEPEADGSAVCRSVDVSPILSGTVKDV